MSLIGPRRPLRPGFRCLRLLGRHVFTLILLTGAIATRHRALAQTSSATASPDITGLPVVEVPATGSSGSVLAVILSGDGGWAAGDKQMAAALARKGIPVVGFDTPSYLRTTRTPDVVASDVGRMLQHYLQAWRKQQVLLIGYSHGADLAPFMVSRWGEELRSRILLLALLGLENHASFRYHLVDVISEAGHQGDLPVRPEVEKLRGLPILCVQGTNESNSLCASLEPALARVATHAGGHTISGNEGADVVDLILSEIGDRIRTGT